MAEPRVWPDSSTGRDILTNPGQVKSVRDHRVRDSESLFGDEAIGWTLKCIQRVSMVRTLFIKVVIKL